MESYQATSPQSQKTLAQLINPNPGQRKFLEAIASHDFVLYGGEGSGGKSYILRWWLVDFLIDCFQSLGLRGVRVGLFCEDYPSLKDRQVTKMQAEFPSWLGRLAKNETWDFTLAPEYGSGQIALRNLDDPSKYVSSEFAAIAVDELTKNPISVFNDLRWRIRWPGIHRRPFGACANPGEEGSLGRAWVKKYWIDRNFPPEFYEGTDPRTGKQRPDITKEFVFIPCKASDNPFLDDGYWQRLLSLPPDMAKRVAYGDWDAASGLYFPHFDLSKHVIPHAEAMARIKPWHHRRLSGDWGFGHPHSFHWHAKNETNHVITYRELWDREVHEWEVGKRITAEEAKDCKLSPLAGFVFSWDEGKLSPRASRTQPRSIGQLLSETLGPAIPRHHPCDSTPGARVARARLMSQLIQAGMWQISDACPKLIQSIQEAMCNPDHPEEILKVDYDGTVIGDDPLDSAGMGLQWMVGNSIKPAHVLFNEKVQQVRTTFLPGQAQAEKPGVDWFAQFGGQVAGRVD